MWGDGRARSSSHGDAGARSTVVCDAAGAWRACGGRTRYRLMSLAAKCGSSHSSPARSDSATSASSTSSFVSPQSSAAMVLRVRVCARRGAGHTTATPVLAPHRLPLAGDNVVRVCGSRAATRHNQELWCEQRAYELHTVPSVSAPVLSLGEAAVHDGSKMGRPCGHAP